MSCKLFFLAIAVGFFSVSCGTPVAPPEKTDDLRAFAVTPITRTELVAGKQCVAKLTFDTDGHLIDVDTDFPCHKGMAQLFIVGPQNKREPLQNNPGGITFGTGTTTCYGPPYPSPPRCVCTKLPCP